MSLNNIAVAYYYGSVIGSFASTETESDTIDQRDEGCLCRFRGRLSNNKRVIIEMQVFKWAQFKRHDFIYLRKNSIVFVLKRGREESREEGGKEKGKDPFRPGP